VTGVHVPAGTVAIGDTVAPRPAALLRQ